MLTKSFERKLTGMTQKHNELHKLGFYFLSVLQAEESGLFMPRGRWAESKRKGAKDVGKGNRKTRAYNGDSCH